MHIQMRRLHAPNAPRLRALSFGRGHEVEALQAFPEAGDIQSDIVISDGIRADEAARLRCRPCTCGAGWTESPARQLPSGTTVCNVHRHEVPKIAEFTLHADPGALPATLAVPGAPRRRRWTQAYADRAQHDEATCWVSVTSDRRSRGARACGSTRDCRDAQRQSGPRNRPSPCRLWRPCAGPGSGPGGLLPLDERTRGLIGARQLACCPRNPCWSMWPVQRWREQALYEALRDKQLGRAVLDVWYRYPRRGRRRCTSRWPLHELPNVRATPHISAMTPALLERRYLPHGPEHRAPATGAAALQRNL